jgi:hypothetical protein
VSRHLEALSAPAHYAAAIDTADWTTLGALFTDDVVVTSGWGQTVGRDATVAGFARRAAAFTRQFHWLANQRALTLGSQQARVTCYFLALVDLQRATPGQVLFRGTYDFTLAWHTGWRIAELRTTYHAGPMYVDQAQPADDLLGALRSVGSPGHTREG